MKPLSSFLGLRLKTAVKIVCKSFILLVSVTLATNLHALDYEGPRGESVIALGVFLMFLVLLTGSAFTGHSGADRESICLVATSLCLLSLAILHWLVVGVISMQKNESETMWNVCIQERCPETLWAINFGYRFINEENAKNFKVFERQQLPSFDSKIKEGILSEAELIKIKPDKNNLKLTPWIKDFIYKRRKKEIELTEGEGHEYDEVNIKSDVTFQPRNFWEGMTVRDTDSTDPATGLSLLVTLLFFLTGFIYFFTCATILCSYCAELYEEFREEEGDDGEEKDNL